MHTSSNGVVIEDQIKNLYFVCLVVEMLDIYSKKNCLTAIGKASF